jgi:hypothetical protein
LPGVNKVAVVPSVDHECHELSYDAERIVSELTQNITSNIEYEIENYKLSPYILMIYCNFHYNKLC